jgi:hypothetical protein
MLTLFANNKNHKFLFGLLLLGSISLLFVRFYITKSVVGGDGISYYSNIRSIVIDRDVDLRNEFEHFHNEYSPYSGNRRMKWISEKDSITNKVTNRFPIGSAIMLIPFFIIGHILALLLQQLGFAISLDGYGPIYQLMTGLGSLFYGFLGLLLIYRLGKIVFNPIIASISAIAICLATPLIYYMTMEPLMAHSLSMFGVTLLVYFWYVTRDNRKLFQWLVLGLIGGLISIIRYQDTFFLLIPLIDTAASIITKRCQQPALRKLILRTLADLGIYFIGAGMLISVQLYINNLSFGSAFKTGYSGYGFSNWATPKFFDTLFSTNSGLLTRSPIIIFSLIGLWWFTKRERLIGALLLLSFLAQWYMISSWWMTSQGVTFGNRILLNSIIIFGIGLMQFLSSLENRKILHTWGIKLCFILISLNGILAGLYCLRIIKDSYTIGN